MIVTIDGPSGSGKSTLALGLANHLNFFCLNSGYLYRGLGYVLKTFYAYDDALLQNPREADIQACLTSGVFRYEYECGLAKIYWIDDITQFLKDPEMAKAAVVLAQNDYVRTAMKQFERSLVAGKDVVVEGRSCGSTIFPEAQVKFYLDAAPEVRAKRFQIDQKKRGNDFSLADALAHIQTRDNIDRERFIDPLVRPEGSFLLDSSIDHKGQVLQTALEHIKHALKKG